MKKLFSLILVCNVLSSQAQITKDSLLKIMNKEACEAVGKRDLSKINKSNMQQEMGNILMPVMLNHLADIEVVYGKDVMTNKDALTKMGMDLGMGLSTNCPKFMEFAMGMGGDMDATKAPAEMDTDEAISNKSSLKKSGTFLTINAGDVTTVTLKDSKGKMEKLYWLEDFYNADFLKTNTKKFANKKVEVYYTEKMIYDSIKKSYKTIKVLTSIELL
jgi:hypothetical protein